MLAGLTFPKTRLNEIKTMAQTNAEIIKKGLNSAKEKLLMMKWIFSEHSIWSQRSQKREEKVSSLDILDEFL